jgi:hypothetical protein
MTIDPHTTLSGMAKVILATKKCPPIAAMVKASIYTIFHDHHTRRWFCRWRSLAAKMVMRMRMALS